MKPARTLALAILFLASLAAAQAIPQRPTGYVNDFAHVLSSGTIDQLDDVCRQIDEKAHAQIAVVTIQSLGGSDIESYAVDLFKKWGIGDKAGNRGVLILLAAEDHRYRIEVGYGLEPILPDGKVGGFGRQAVPLLKQNDFNGAVVLMTSRVAEVIAQDAGIQLTGASPQEPAAREPKSGLPPIVIIILILIVLVTPPLRRLLFWFLVFGGGGRGGGGWSGGGGWGGGGGGFGGFGGGSSGGGGASGSW